MSLSLDEDEIEITNLKPNEELYKGELQYTPMRSSGSFKFSEVEGFIFGGLSSRFWMLRKHINSLDMQDKILKKSLAFKSWECITIILERRDVNLVIKDEQGMNDILTMLIYYTNTIDGNRNSATLMKHNIVKKRIYNG